VTIHAIGSVRRTSDAEYQRGVDSRTPQRAVKCESARKTASTHERPASAQCIQRCFCGADRLGRTAVKREREPAVERDIESRQRQAHEPRRKQRCTQALYEQGQSTLP
jgi:hypothetical protein